MIRPARPADVPAILGLIHELARYEGHAGAVVNDVPALTEALFGVAATVFAHVCEVEAEIVGAAVWFLNYSTWTGRNGIYLEDLIVTEAHRGSGKGRLLLAELARICVARGYPRLEWSVLGWNAPAIGFYRHIGAEPMGEWNTLRLSGSRLDELAAESARSV